MTTELLICPLCGAEIHRHLRDQVQTKIRIPYDSVDVGGVMSLLAKMAADERAAELALAEQACVEHYEEKHDARLRLWRRFGWTWLMRWPTREPKPLLPDQERVDPLRFIAP